jgi:hypothetical protein
MFVPRHLTWPIFYAYPDALQMFFYFPISKSMTAICKAVLLLTPFIKNLHDNWASGRLPGLTILPVLSGGVNNRPSILTFKQDHKRQFAPGFKKKVLLLTRTVGVINLSQFLRVTQTTLS